jgi:hypothetical protein
MRYSLESPQLRHDKPLNNGARKSYCYRAGRIQTHFKPKAVAVSLAKILITLKTPGVQC